MADAEAMGRLISLALRSGIPLMEIHRQLRGISSDRAVGLGPNKVLSVPDAIGIALEEWWRDEAGRAAGPARASRASSRRDAASRAGGGAAVAGRRRRSRRSRASRRTTAGETFMGTCPDCGSQLEYAEGCVKCHVCGF